MRAGKNRTKRAEETDRQRKRGEERVGEREGKMGEEKEEKGIERGTHVQSGLPYATPLGR